MVLYQGYKDSDPGLSSAVAIYVIIFRIFPLHTLAPLSVKCMEKVRLDRL